MKLYSSILPVFVIGIVYAVGAVVFSVPAVILAIISYSLLETYWFYHFRTSFLLDAFRSLIS